MKIAALGRSLALVVGGATAAAGLVLVLASLQGVAATRYIVVGLYAIYCALLIVRRVFDWNITTGNSFLDILCTVFTDNFALLGTGIISAGLLYQAFGADGVNPFVYGLAAPCLVALVYGFSGSKESKTDDDIEDAEATEPESEVGKVNWIAGLGESVIAAGQTGLLYAVMILAMGAGFILFTVLQSALFEETVLSFARFWTMSAAFYQSYFPFVAITAIIMAVVALLLGLGSIASAWLPLAGRRNANRDLSPQELLYIDESAATVLVYGRERGYDQRDWCAILALGCLYLPLICLCVFALYKGFFPGSTAPVGVADGLYLYLPPKAGPSCALMTFAVIAIAYLPKLLLMAVWRRYAEYTTWRMLAQTAPQGVPLVKRLVSYVRASRIDTASPIVPHTFLVRAGLMTERWYLLFIVPMIAFTGWIYWLDSRNFDLVTDDGITVVQYWTGKPVSYPWSAVEGAELECTFDDGLEFHYDLSLRGDYRVDITRTLRKSRDLATVMAIDERVRSLGVPVTFATRKPLWQAPKSAFKPACVRQLADEFGDVGRESIPLLFHLAEWRQQAGN